MFYCGFNNLIGWLNGGDEIVNAPIAGALAGGLYKVAGSWRARVIYSFGSAGAFYFYLNDVPVFLVAIFSGISYASRQGYL